MVAPGLDANLDHELNRQIQSCDVVTQSDSVGLVRVPARRLPTRPGRPWVRTAPSRETLGSAAGGLASLAPTMARASGLQCACSWLRPHSNGRARNLAMMFEDRCALGH